MWSLVARNGRNYIWLICVAFVAFLSFSIIAGCGSGKEFQKLQDQYATVEKERNELKKRAQTLEEENATLKKQIDGQIEEIGALKRRLTDAGLSETPDEANFEVCKKNLKDIATALKLYATDNGGLFPKNLEKISPNPKYLEFIPTCPSVTRDTYSIGYEVTKDKKLFTVSCEGHNHAKILIKEGFPKYSSVTGVLVEKDVKKETSEDEEEPVKEQPKENEKKDTTEEGK